VFLITISRLRSTATTFYGTCASSDVTDINHPFLVDTNQNGVKATKTMQVQAREIPVLTYQLESIDGGGGGDVESNVYLPAGCSTC
jgi:hypothetical protein